MWHCGLEKRNTGLDAHTRQALYQLGDICFFFFFLRIRFVFVTQANRTSRSPCLSFLCWHCKCGLHLSLPMPVVCSCPCQTTQRADEDCVFVFEAIVGRTMNTYCVLGTFWNSWPHTAHVRGHDWVSCLSDGCQGLCSLSWLVAPSESHTLPLVFSSLVPG